MHTYSTKSILNTHLFYKRMNVGGAFVKMVLDVYILLAAEALSMKIKELENFHIQNFFLQENMTILYTLNIKYCVTNITNGAS